MPHQGPWLVNKNIKLSPRGKYNLSKHFEHILRMISGYIDYYSLIVLYGSSIPKYNLPNTFRPTSFLGITGSVFALNFLSSTSCLLSLKKWRRYLKYQWKVELCVVFKILLQLFDCGSNVLTFWNLVFYFQWL